MENKFTINFRICPEQNIQKGSTITYLDEFRLSTIKEYLMLKTDFFVVDDIVDTRIKITNGLDTIETTEDQIVEVLAFIEEIPQMNKPRIGEDPSRYIRNLIKWKEAEEVRISYPIKDDLLSIVSAGLIITSSDFEIRKLVNEKNNTSKLVACLIPERISLYL